MLYGSLRHRNILLTSLIIISTALSLQSQKAVRDSLQDRLDYYRNQSNFQITDTTYINTINRFAQAYRYHNADSLFLLSKHAHQYSEQARHIEGTARALHGIGCYLMDLGKYSEAVPYYDKALQQAKNLNKPSFVVRVLNDIAVTHRYMRELSVAYNFYLEAIKIAESTQNLNDLSLSYENIAIMHLEQDDYDNALEYYKKVTKVNDALGDSFIQAQTSVNMALTYIKNKQYDKAIKPVNFSIKIFEKDTILDWLAFAYLVKGTGLSNKGLYADALDNYNKSKFLLKDWENEREKVELHNGIARAYLGQGKDSISSVYAMKALTAATKYEMNKEIKTSAHTLYSLRKKEGEITQALTYHELFTRMNDSITKNNQNNSLVLLNAKNLYDKKIALLAMENKEELDRQKNLVYAAFLILILSVLCVFIEFTNRKQQTRLNTALLNETAALEQNKQVLLETNRTKDKLFSIIGQDLREPIGAFQKLLSLFNNGEINQKEFVEFMPKLRKDINHISFTLNNLLHWGKTYMKDAERHAKPTDLGKIVQQNIQYLQETATKKSIKIINLFPQNVQVCAETGEIDLVLQNLLNNAIKFTPANGAITVEANEKRQEWEIAITDTGIGIGDEIKEKIFNMNLASQTYGTENERGTGLGLAVCQRMVQLNKGEIWVESSQFRGSSFFFTLPKPKNKYQNAV